MMEEADVVVVGAGPAGSTAAEHAALNGAEVVLLERREEIGVPVKCGEFMPSVSEIKDIFPMAKDLESLFDVPNDLISLETESIRIFSPKQKSYDLPFLGYTTDRDRFDQFLARKAERAGARLIKGCSCRSVEGNTVVTESGSIKAKVIIGADGPHSRVARSIGIPKARELCPAVTAQIKGDFENVSEMFFGNIAPGAYAWIIPKKDGANIGLGISPRFAKKSVKEYFLSFVEEKGFDVDVMKGKHVPMSGPVNRSVVGNTLVVGDAAGHVMAVNGGGIPIAMICGRIAGKSAAKTALKGASLEIYDSIWRRQVEKPLKTAVRTKKLADIAWGNPLRLEMAMSILGKRRMGNMIRCKSIFP